MHSLSYKECSDFLLCCDSSLFNYTVKKIVIQVKKHKKNEKNKDIMLKMTTFKDIIKMVFVIIVLERTNYGL